jgi:hypothetical protein
MQVNLFRTKNEKRNPVMIVDDDGNILAFSSSSAMVKKLVIKTSTVLQDYKKGDIIVALAVFWLMVCERYNVRPEDMIGFAKRLRDDTYDNKHNHEFRALKDYLDNEF